MSSSSPQQGPSSRPKRRRDSLPPSSPSNGDDLPPSSLPPSSPPQPFSDLDDEPLEDEEGHGERAIRQEREELDDDLQLGSDEGEGEDLRVGGLVACVSSSLHLCPMPSFYYITSATPIPRPSFPRQNLSLTDLLIAPPVRFVVLLCTPVLLFSSFLPCLFPRPALPPSSGDDDVEEYNSELDNYSEADIDDAEYEAMSVAQRRAADEAMSRRDKRARAGRRQRDRAPAFMQSDDEDERQEGDDPLQGINQRRRRRQYDEVRPEDDMDGVEDEIPFQDLGDIKAASINEWVAIPAVQRSITRHFKQFLMTYVDENGQSVYGQAIKTLGERAYLASHSSFSGSRTTF